MKKNKQLSVEEHDRFAQELYRMRIIASQHILRFEHAYPKASRQAKTAWKLYHAIETMRCEMDNVYCRSLPEDQLGKPCRGWAHSPYFNPSVGEHLREKIERLSSIDETSATAVRIYVENEYLIIDIDYEYSIELGRCNTPAKILGWIEHLSGKTWMDAKSLNMFAQVAFQQIGIPVDRNLV